jgi:hypothetical protein
MFDGSVNPRNFTKVLEHLPVLRYLSAAAANHRSELWQTDTELLKMQHAAVAQGAQIDDGRDSATHRTTRLVLTAMSDNPVQSTSSQLRA